MWDAELVEMLDVLNSGFPAVERMEGPEARTVVAARRAPVTNRDDVAGTEDRELSGPGGPLPVRLYRPHGDPARTRPVVVFFHGGGFVFCDIESHDGFCREMARAVDSVVVSVGYRLAPEHRAPAAAQDALAAVRWVADHAGEIGADRDRVVVAGDSAGGNLAAVAALMAQEAGVPALAAQVLIYPVVSSGCDTDSFDRFSEGWFNTAAAMRWYWRQYLPEEGIPEPAHHVEPLAAPSFAGLPPALVVTAANDPLADEGRELARALRADGVSVLHREYGGLFHGFLTIGPLQAAQSARAVLWRDLRRLLGVPHAAPGPDTSVSQPQGASA